MIVSPTCTNSEDGGGILTTNRKTPKQNENDTINVSNIARTFFFSMKESRKIVQKKINTDGRKICSVSARTNIPMVKPKSTA
jgi:hypothetical protein